MLARVFRLLLGGIDVQMSRQAAADLEAALRAELGSLLNESYVSLQDDSSHPHPRGMDFIILILTIGASTVRVIRDRGELVLDHSSVVYPDRGTIFSCFLTTKKLAPGSELCVIRAGDLLRENWMTLKDGNRPS